MANNGDRIEMAPSIGLAITLQFEDGKTVFTVNGMARHEGPERIVHSTYCVTEPTPEALRALAEACDRYADRMTAPVPKPAPGLPGGFDPDNLRELAVEMAREQFKPEVG